MAGEVPRVEFGIGTLLAIMAVAAILFFVPLGMGPVKPPSTVAILFIPVILVAVWIILNRSASN